VCVRRVGGGGGVYMCKYTNVYMYTYLYIYVRIYSKIYTYMYVHAYVLRWGWVFLERKRILNGIQFTAHFIEFLVVETKRFFGSFVNVILTRQTCGQRSSRLVENKRRALGNYFSERICYMFQDRKM